MTHLLLQVISLCSHWLRCFSANLEGTFLTPPTGDLHHCIRELMRRISQTHHQSSVSCQNSGTDCGDYFLIPSKIHIELLNYTVLIVLVNWLDNQKIYHPTMVAYKSTQLVTHCDKISTTKLQRYSLSPLGMWSGSSNIFYHFISSSSSTDRPRDFPSYTVLLSI